MYWFFPWRFWNFRQKQFHIRSSLDTLCTNPMRLVWKILSVFVENACTLSLLKSTFLTCFQFLGRNWLPKRKIGELRIWNSFQNFQLLWYFFLKPRSKDTYTSLMPGHEPSWMLNMPRLDWIRNVASLYRKHNSWWRADPCRRRGVVLATHRLSCACCPCASHRTVRSNVRR